jgi:fatty-acyl-CoA synthase
MAYHSNLRLNSSYLWTLPMFHCNGWCYAWAVTAAAAVHICQRHVDPNAIWEKICDGGITHMSAAPTILTMIVEAADKARDRRPPWPIQIGTGGSPPSPSLLARLAALNIDVTHLYGMTETYGPAVINQWQPEWSAKSEAEKSHLNARQGIGNVVTQGIRVVNPDGDDVPADGKSLGEIVIRGNNTAMGYYRDEEATLAARSNGWFHTHDLGVRYPDGYIELKDRAKDIIVTGGENVASVEIEKVLADHPCVLESAVVAREDSRWGEVPVAFVVIRSGTSATEAELISFVRDRIAHFKAPKEIRFEDLPKTSTGKIQKHILRARLTISSSDS